MAEMKMAPMMLKLDASEAIKRIEDAIALLKLPSGSLESIPEHGIDLLLGSISSLLDNIVLSYLPPASGAGNVNEITFKVEIIGSLDDLTSAIRAHNFQLNRVAH